MIGLLFRLGWGFFGPLYSRFQDFPTGKKNIKTFIKESFEEKSSFIGHNPMASYVMLTIFVVTFLIIVSGALTYGIQENRGIFSFLSHGFLKELELFESLHELFANVLYFLIFSHLIGIVIDKKLHSKMQTLHSIFTGYKSTHEKIIVKLNFVQKSFSLLILLLFIIFVLYMFYNPQNILIH